MSLTLLCPKCIEVNHSNITNSTFWPSVVEFFENDFIFTHHFKCTQSVRLQSLSVPLMLNSCLIYRTEQKKFWIRNLHNIKCFINPVEWKLRRPSIFMGSFSSLFLSKMDWKSFYSFPSCLTFFTMLKFIQVLPFVHARPFIILCKLVYIRMNKCSLS